MRLTIKLQQIGDTAHTLEFDDSEIESEDEDRYEFWQDNILPIFKEFIKTLATEGENASQGVNKDS